MNKQKPMKHTWGIWISFLNWIARFSSTILLSDGANKANTTWLMKCLSFIRLQLLLPKCFQSCDRTTSSVAANFTVAISLIRKMRNTESEVKFRMHAHSQ
jgi:hypothetical protein